MSRRSVFLALVAALALFGIPSRATVAGAQLPALRPVSTIGCEMCEGPSQLTVIHDVAVRANGEVIVSDRAEPMLRWFSADGRVLWSHGRRGRGPGEFMYPMRLAPMGSDGLRVLDPRTSRVTQLGRDGGERSSGRLTRFVGDAARVGDTGELLLLLDDFRGDYRIERWPVGADTGRVIATLPRPARPAGEPHVPPGIAGGPNGELAVVVLPVEYRIHRFDRAGARLPDIVRTVERRRRSEAELAQRRTLSGGGSGGAPAGAARDDPRLYHPHIAPFGVQYDGAGRLWVHTLRGEEGTTTFDVFAPSGAFLGEVRVPMKAVKFSVAGGYLAVAGEDESGVPRVWVWAVL